MIPADSLGTLIGGDGQGGWDVTIKQQILKALDSLPDDAGFEDAMERLYLLYKIQQGLDQDEGGEGIPHEEVEKQMRVKWPE